MKNGGIKVKSTGIVRKVDELGRIVIPMELRRSLDINVKDPMEIFLDGDCIIMQKYKQDMTCIQVKCLTTTSSLLAVKSF